MILTTEITTELNVNLTATTLEELKHYVYALVDSRDNKIFYIGKVQGARILAHINSADQSNNEKSSLIKEIIESGNSVKHYIIRHGLENENDAITLGSVLIDLFRCGHFDFSTSEKLTNKQGGEDADEKVIQTLEDIELRYGCERLENSDFEHKVLTISIGLECNIRKIGAITDEIEKYKQIYEATRTSWV